MADDNALVKEITVRRLKDEMVAAVNALEFDAGTIVDATAAATAAGVSAAAALQSEQDAEAARDAAVAAEAAFMATEKSVLDDIMGGDVDGLAARVGSVLTPVPRIPAGFRGLTVLPYPKIIRRVGAFATSIDFSALRPATGRIYYANPAGPIGAATGDTPADATSLSSCFGKSDVGTIVLADGEYHRETVSPGGSALTKSFNLLAADGARPVVTGWNTPTVLTWVLVSGNIYSTSRAATTAIVDIQNLTTWGDYRGYTKRVDLATIAAPGEWAIVGSTVYVWPLGNTDLSVGENRAQIRLQVAAVAGVLLSGAGNVAYVEGIDFYGTDGASLGGIEANNESIIIVKNCTVKYNQRDGFTTEDGGHMIAIDCEASSNALDGFNYHDVPQTGGEFVEIDCWGHHNGLVDPDNNNATTAHEAVTGIRVNGLYEESGGPTVADVNSAHTWNIGCHSGSRAVPTTSVSISWLAGATVGETNPTRMWLDECTAAGSDYAVGATGPAIIYGHALGLSSEITDYMPGSNPVGIVSFLR